MGWLSEVQCSQALASLPSHPAYFGTVSIMIARLRVERCQSVAWWLRAKLLRLRQKAGGLYTRKDLLLRLMAESVSTFCVLFRHALRLAGGQPEWKKHEVITQTHNRFGIAPEAFHKLLDLREGKVKEKDVDSHALLGPYLYQIEEVIRVVDQLGRQEAEH